ncbi:MAG: phosphopantothenoylcysteine decarboxylase, partial [Actinobacteria bacterium]|nr:phosphopantothenoylcysteine decarboxylase [Actinomycetota bacterium]
PQGAQVTPVETADQMQDALEEFFEDSDVLVMCAAVADAKPRNLSEMKIKKKDLHSIELVANPDLLATISHNRKAGQIIVGFAAETSNLELHAQNKLDEKGLDMIFVNDVSGGAIFGSDQTHGRFLFKDAPGIEIAPTSKDTLAHELLNQVRNRLS